jgi:CRISPR/Cas system CMR-associated protein Cmr3 (group 5 of RAMP superfamily)
MYQHESNNIFEACNIDKEKFYKKMISIGIDLEKWEQENKKVPPFSVQIEIIEKTMTKKEIALLATKFLPSAPPTFFPEVA